MKKTASMVPAAILIVCLLWLSLAGAWTLTGFVYIDDEGDGEVAPCVLIHFYNNTSHDCAGEYLSYVRTDNDGYYEWSVPAELDTFWAKAILDPTLPCEYCDWDTSCVKDSICKMGTVLDQTSGIIFEFEQSECHCD